MSDILKNLGIRFPTRTNPDYVKKLLTLTRLSILLHPPENPKANKAIEFLRKLTNESVDFAPLEQAIILGIDRNQLTKKAVSFQMPSAERDLLFTDNRDLIPYYLLLLEVIVRLMLNDVYFYGHVMDSFSEKTHSIAHYKNSILTMVMGAIRLNDPFVGVKIASVKPALLVDRFIREKQEYIDEFTRKHRLALANKSAINRNAMLQLSVGGLSLNIAEATVKDKSHDNKVLGAALIARLGENPIRKEYKKNTTSFPNAIPESDFWTALYSHEQTDNKILQLPEIDARWNDLYVIWNLIFVLRNYPKFSVFFFSKLFIPSVLNGENSFLIARIYAIWISFFAVECSLASTPFFSVFSMKNNSKEKLLDSWIQEVLADAVSFSSHPNEALVSASRELETLNSVSARKMYHIGTGRGLFHPDYKKRKESREKIVHNISRPQQ